MINAVKSGTSIGQVEIFSITYAIYARQPTKRGRHCRQVRIVMVTTMNQNNIQQLFEAISSGSDDAISSAIVDLEYDEPTVIGGGIPDGVFDCLARACEASAGRASGSLPVVSWFPYSSSKFTPVQKGRARKLIADLYGSIVDSAAALTAAEWFGAFADETSLQFAARWLDEWASMTDAAQSGLDGFFFDSFELQELRKDSAYLERLILLEQRYDALPPRHPLSLPRH